MLEWSFKWLLNFNVIKSFVMHLDSSYPCHSYLMDDQPIKVSKHKDLGIIVDSSLKFCSQATSVTNKANCVLRLMKRSFTTLDFQYSIRLHFEYANVFWGPNYIGD